MNEPPSDPLTPARDLPGDSSALKSDLELSKLREEILKVQTDRKKAELEIAELTRWYRRPSTLQPIAAIVIALVTAAFGVANGWFSTSLDKLKIEEDKLATGNTTLAKERDRLAQEGLELRQRLETTAQQAKSLGDSLRSAAKPSDVLKYQNEIHRLSQELGRVGADASGAAAATGPPTDSRSGTVVDSVSGQGIFGAEIALRDGDALLSLDKSNLGGIFHLQFEFLARPSATITIKRAGYQTRAWTRDSLPKFPRFEIEPNR